ncbi:MAG TPA: ATP synthase F1 subunit gamma [Candidatus Acidoferrales bacterium]|nr:ATP synthase F1 subunit gamma [Candidatus Acidoferrales bacterium]
MPTLLDYRRRIRSVKSTQQITRAMKFVAAAKLRRAQEGVFAARPYAREILRVLHSAAARVESTVHPLLERRPEERVLVVVLTGDRSLCGAFNSNVIRRASIFMRENRSKKLEVLAVGKKGRNALKREEWALAAEYVNVSGNVNFDIAKEIASKIGELYESGKVDAVYTVYNEFKNVLTQRLRTEKLLPIDPAILGETEGPETRSASQDREEESLPHDLSPAGQSMVEYIYEEPITEIFRHLVPRYVQSEVFRILLESEAAEWAARMTAMDSATRNAAELIDKVTLQMNKTRQAAITKELIEIVSGAASATS